MASRRYCRIVGLTLASCVLLLQSVANEPVVRGGPDVAFNTEALAVRAVFTLHTWAVHLRALLNRGCSKSAATQKEQDPGPPSDGASGGRSNVESGDSPSPSTLESAASLERAFGLNEPEWDIPRLHAASLSVMEALNSLVAFGVLHPIWVKDATAQSGTDPTESQTLDYLRQHPQAITLFDWSLPEAGIVDQLLHERMGGGVLPLGPSVKLERFRQRLRELRVIWLVTPNAGETPSEDMRAAAGDLLFLSAILKRTQELDPSLAILTGPDPSRGGLRRKPPIESDATLIEDAVTKAGDVAIWDEDPTSASRLLRNTKRFLERLVATYPDGTEQKKDYRQWIRRVDSVLEELRVRPRAFATDERRKTWQMASGRTRELLASVIGDGLTVRVPDGEVLVKSPTGGFEVIALSVGRASHVAPWLYGVDVSVFQQIALDQGDNSVAVSGLPIALTNSETGQKWIRRFIRVDLDDAESELSSASFADLTPGTYRVEIVEPGPAKVGHDHDDINGGGRDFGRVASLLQRLRNLRERIRGAWFSRGRVAPQHRQVDGFGAAA